MIDIQNQMPNFGLDMLKGWHVCNCSNYDSRKELYLWLETTHGGLFWVGLHRIYFEREEDMILFTLTWS